jgi:hypothetical protein
MPTPKNPSAPGEPAEPTARKTGYAATTTGATGATGTTGTTGATGAGVAAPGELVFPYFVGVEGVQADSIRSCADAYYEGMFERIGAYRAVARLAERFLDGLDLGSGELRDRLVEYIRRQPLRLTPEDRNRVILRMFADTTLESLMVRFSDAMIAWDLSRRPAGTALTPSLVLVPESAARLAVIAAIEDLELFLDAEGAGGVGFVTDEAGKQLIEAFAILDDPDLRVHVAGDDVDDMFAVITGLLTGEEDVPTDVEAHQMARMASSGRKVFLKIADHVDGFTDVDDGAFDGDLATLGALVYQWRAAHGSLSPDVTDAAAGTAGQDEDAADESRLQVIRLRRAS